MTEKHWAVRLFKEKEADFNRRHPGPIARVEFDGAEHGPYCPTADYACVCGLFDRQHAVAVLVEFLRKISATNAQPVLERPA